jgi:hypothetical protein
MTTPGGRLNQSSPATKKELTWSQAKKDHNQQGVQDQGQAQLGFESD